MKITFATSLVNFAEKVEPLLLKKESCNNLMLGLLNRLLENEKSYDEYYLGFVEENDEVIFAFMQTPPNNWILADVENLENRIVPSVATYLYENNRKVPGVLGPTMLTKLFIDEWSRLTNSTANIQMEQLIYQLDVVNDNVIKSSGELVEADEGHHTLITEWLMQFGREANVTTTHSQAVQLATNFINNRSVYLWKVDGNHVSMVNQSRKTKNGATINAVFTPDEYKRNGYATSAVAALSRKILTSGFQFCNLYTDQANPTSNSIYKKIGYYEVGDSIVYTFA